MTEPKRYLPGPNLPDEVTLRSFTYGGGSGQVLDRPDGEHLYFGHGGVAEARKKVEGQ